MRPLNPPPPVTLRDYTSLHTFSSFVNEENPSVLNGLTEPTLLVFSCIITAKNLSFGERRDPEHLSGILTAAHETKNQ